MAGAIRRVPAIADAPVTRMINGPEGFTPDNEFILGESEVRGLFVAAGFCAHGIAGAGGIGRQVASWIVDGEPELDLWQMDIRRFGAQYRSRSYTLARSLENYATYYDIHYPNEERLAGRPLRVSPGVRAARGARRLVRREVLVGARELVRAERRRGRRGVGDGAGGAAAARLGGRALEPGDRRRGAGDADDGGPVRRDVVRQDRGRRAGRGRAPPVAVRQRRGPGGRRDHVHPAAQPPRRHRVRPDGDPGRGGPVPARHRDGVRQPRPRLDPAPRARATARCCINDVTSGRVCYALWGPRARDILAATTRTTCRTRPSRTSPRGRSASGDVPVYALRVTYVGELGWELYAPAEYGAALWDTLWRAGAPHGLVAGGYRAIDALRLEKGYRAWAADITPEETPFEAGLGFAVALDRGEFLGRDALVAAKAAGPRKRLRCLVLDDPRSVCLGNEPVRVDGGVVGRVTSGGYGFSVGRSIAYAYLPPGRRRSARAARSTCSGRGSAARSRGSRCSTRPARGSGPEQGIIGVMSDASTDAYGPAWSAGRARAPEAQLREWLDFALEACDAADATAREHFRRDLDLERKPDRTFVTVADRAIEREIRSRILARWPDHGLVGEEYGEAAGGSATRWFIDPIDGTHNFIRGVPLFGTLLAVEHEGEMQVGVISAPAMRERWFASRGGGAWCDGPDGRRAIRVSRVGRDRGRAAGVRQPSRQRGERPDARLRRPDRRLVARPRVRRLLGLRAGRRGGRRGHDGDRGASLGPRRAAGRHRGGRRARDRRRRRAADRRRVVRRLERRCSTTRSCAGCGRPGRPTAPASARPAERRERPAHGADGERRQHAEQDLVVGEPGADRRRDAEQRDRAEQEQAQPALAGERRVRVDARRSLRLGPVGGGRAPTGGAARTRAPDRIVAAHRRQPQQRTARLRQRPRVGRIEEVLGDRHRAPRRRSRRPARPGRRRRPVDVHRDPVGAGREDDAQPLVQRGPDAVAGLVEQLVPAGRRDRALERPDQPVALVGVARAQTDRRGSPLRPRSGRSPRRRPRPAGARPPLRAVDRRLGSITSMGQARPRANSRHTAPSAMARTTPTIG